MPPLRLDAAAISPARRNRVRKLMQNLFTSTCRCVPVCVGVCIHMPRFVHHTSCQVYYMNYEPPALPIVPEATLQSVLDVCDCKGNT